MSAKKTALFVGRFQPFHRGHLSVAVAALKKFDYLVIAIGSSDKFRTPENPFTVGERHAMVKESLEEAGFSISQFKVVPVPDVNDDTKWPKHITDLCPKFDLLITGNPKVKELFEAKYKKLEIIVPKQKYKITGTEVRAAIKAGEDLEKYLPTAVIGFLRKIGAARKLVDIDEELALAAAAATQAA